MLLICKKREEDNIKHHPAIRLLSVLLKNFNNVLTTRLASVQDSTLIRTRAGFRGQFTTMNHIQIVAENLNKHNEYYLPICLTFIDYERTFVSVYKKAVIKYLEAISIVKPYFNKEDLGDLKSNHLCGQRKPKRKYRR